MNRIHRFLISSFKELNMEATGKLTASPNDVKSTLERGVDKAAMGIHDTITSVSDSARPAVDRMESSAHDVVDRAAGVASHTAATLGIKGEQLKSAQKRLMENARDYVREHPVASLGIAVATGYVLSRLLSSRYVPPRDA
jgi:ElaB/YqjD/DUF883 family membrane-anchored ribosome-binding protein